MKQEVVKETKCEDLREKVDEAPREICKLSQYIKMESEKENITLKMEVNSVKTLVVLYTRAKVSIVTKEVWAKWGHN